MNKRLTQALARRAATAPQAILETYLFEGPLDETILLAMLTATPQTRPQ